jgi:hypothetical protein
MSTQYGEMMASSPVLTFLDSHVEVGKGDKNSIQNKTP